MWPLIVFSTKDKRSTPNVFPVAHQVSLEINVLGKCGFEQRLKNWLRALISSNMNFSSYSFVLSVLKRSRIFAVIHQLVGIFPSLYQHKLSKECDAVYVLVITATFEIFYFWSISWYAWTVNMQKVFVCFIPQFGTIG